MPRAYNVIALSNVLNSLKNKGYPHEINASATPGKCDSARCSAWFTSLAAMQPPRRRELCYINKAYRAMLDLSMVRFSARWFD